MHSSVCLAPLRWFISCKASFEFSGISDLHKPEIRAPLLPTGSLKPAGVYKASFVYVRSLPKARQSKTYFSVFSTEAIMDVKNIRQRAVQIPKLFSKTLRLFNVYK